MRIKLLKEKLVLPAVQGHMIGSIMKQKKKEKKDNVQSVQNQRHCIKHSSPTSTLTMPQC